MSVTIKQNRNKKEIYYVNGKTVIINENNFVSSEKLTKNEDNVFSEYFRILNKKRCK